MLKMIHSLIILWNALITTILSAHISYCNDECLLSKLKINGIMKNTKIIFPSYDIFNNVYKDSAVIWTDPCAYFSITFLQTFTNKQRPTNNDFRKEFYNRYTKADNLQINTNNPKNINIQSLNNVLSMHRFDGYMYSDNNNRVLLGHNDESNTQFDMLNQRTWDEFDWFLYVFSICSFGSCCLFCGCCIHKKYIADQILHVDDIDHRKVTLSPKSPDECNEYIQDILSHNPETLQSVKIHMCNNVPIQPINNMIYETDNTMLKIVSPTLIKQPQPQESEVDVNVIPSKTALPLQRSIDAVASPDSAEPSKSHLSFEMFVQRLNSTGSDIQSIGYTAENSINKVTNGGENITHDNESKNNESFSVPLKKVQSVKLKGLDTIDEVNENIERSTSCPQINK